MPPAFNQRTAPTLTSRIIIAFLSLAILAGCSMPKFKVPQVYKVSVQQGNVITQEMIDKLKPGMTRSQVAYIMGEPILRNTFDETRWDYVYTISIPGYFEQDLRMSLFFEQEALAYFTGDFAPSLSQDEDEDGNEDEEEDGNEDEAVESENS